MFWRRLLGLAVCWVTCALVSGVTGCSPHSGVVSEVSGVERAAVRSTRIPDDVLEDLGLETVWYVPASSTDNPVHRRRALRLRQPRTDRSTGC